MVLASSVLLVACGGATAEDPPLRSAAPPAESSEESHVAQAPPATGAGRRVELLEAGAEPRRVLRYEILESSTLRARFWHEQRIQLLGDPDSTAVRVRVLVVVRLGPTVRTDSEGSRVPVTVERMTVLAYDSAPHATEGRDVADMNGPIGSYDIEPNGSVTHVQPRPREGAPGNQNAAAAELLRNLSRAVVPLPTEEIGVGARWRTHETATIGDTELPRITTYELTGLDRSQGAFEALTSMHQTAEGEAPSGRGPCPGHSGSRRGRFRLSALSLDVESRADVDYIMPGTRDESAGRCNHASQLFFYEATSGPVSTATGTGSDGE